MKKVILLIVLAFSLSINAQEKSGDNFKKTDEVLSEVVKKALNVAEKTGDFVIEQAPLLLQEFYNWHICSNIFGIVLGLLLCFLGYKIPFLWITKKREEKEYMDDMYFNRYSESAFVGWIVFAIFDITGLIFLFASIYELVFILVAPKLYLIEYFIK